MSPEIINRLELSTQLLIHEARRRGVAVEIVDPEDNFLRLERGGRVEYVKQATRTSADTYISALIMENKEVTKRVLRDAGLPVPGGSAVGSLSEAAAAWPAFEGRSVVIKPRSTNFGQAVTILHRARWEPDGREAVERAFAEDGVVLLEEFVSGPEYRFLVIGGEAIAVLHRIAANVTGDGVHTIRDLVEEKNRDPRRGAGYVKPLEKLRLDGVELAHLAAQGLSPDAVPAAGQTVYLRENSNISTGGDSLDLTDEVHAGYKEAAVRAAAAVGARICGADVIIPDIHAEPVPGSFSIIELNFNPALHIHAFPYKGANRRPEAHVLDLLGFREAGEGEPSLSPADATATR